MVIAVIDDLIGCAVVNDARLEALGQDPALVRFHNLPHFGSQVGIQYELLIEIGIKRIGEFKDSGVG